MRNLRSILMAGSTGICSADGDGDAGIVDGTGGGGGGGDAAQAAAAAAALAAQNQTPWFSTFDADTQGVLQTKGWDKLTPDQAAAQAIASYREAEKFLGVPKDQLLRRPDPADPAAVAAFYQQLGKPASKDQYDFSTVKFADGTALDDGFIANMRDTADALNLPKDTATQVVASVVKFMESADATEREAATAAVTQQQAELKKEWANNYDAHKFVAQQGALKVGVSQAEFDQMFETPGGAKMLNIFRKIGEMNGEGRFVNNQGPGGGLLTREQAVAAKNGAMNDEAWVTRYNAGGVSEVGQMTAWNTIIVGDSEEANFFG